MIEKRIDFDFGIVKICRIEAREEKITMAPTYHLDDLPSLRKMIDEKAHDLFKEKKGHAGLQVTRVFKRPAGKSGGIEKNGFVKGLDVGDIAQVQAMKNVRPPTFIISTLECLFTGQ